MNYRTEYERWCNSPILTAEEKATLAAPASEEEREMAFGRTLSFGTAGLRSTMALGPGHMNVYTVAQATQGMADLILSEGGAARGAVIAYDSRHNSALFARVSAQVLAANGIRVYLFDDIRPTPELSFAVRELSCIAGINITASHNPRAYNGYKAYWEDGAQLAPEQAEQVSTAIAKVDVLGGAKMLPYEQALADGKIQLLGEDFDEKYLAAVAATAIDAEVVRRAADELKIVYTPLHGAGRRLVPEILKRIGLCHIYPVAEQMIPDGDFPTVVKPNPEYEEVFRLGIALAEQVGSDLVIATDPDSDRVGVVSRTKDGGFATISGNSMGALLLDYVIRARRAAGKLPGEAFAIKSIVSTDMVSRIAEVQKVKLHDVLTGFKYIGEVIKNHEQAGLVENFIFAFEESYGYLFGSYARDKDAVGTSMMIAEMTAYYKLQGMTLSDALTQLYETYGHYRELTQEIYMEGLDGIERRERVMTRLRQNPPKALGGSAVRSVGDYRLGYFTDTVTGEKTPTGQTESDVLYFITDGGDKVVIRPSGTEPKIKIYFLLHAENAASAEEKLAAYVKDAADFAAV